MLYRTKLTGKVQKQSDKLSKKDQKNITTKNNINSNSIRYIVFKEESKWYAVALELNIVEEGSSPSVVLLSLFEAIHGYIKVAIKNKLDFSVLNQKTGKEYEKMWGRIMKQKSYLSGKA